MNYKDENFCALLGLLNGQIQELKCQLDDTEQARNHLESQNWELREANRKLEKTPAGSVENLQAEITRLKYDLTCEKDRTKTLRAEIENLRPLDSALQADMIFAHRYLTQGVGATQMKSGQKIAAIKGVRDSVSYESYLHGLKQAKEFVESYDLTIAEHVDRPDVGMFRTMRTKLGLVVAPDYYMAG